MKTTLLITTYNRGHLLNNSLQRLCLLTLPDDILVVDDGSIDNTKDVVESFKTKLPIRYIYNHNPGWSICSFARNIGIKNTDSEIIITAEPEILFVSDVVKQMLEARKTHKDQVITAGSVYHMQPGTGFHPGFKTDPYAAFKDMPVEVHEIQPRSYSPNGLVKTVGWVATFCSLYEKKWLEEINGWDEDMPGIWGFDDHDLLTRLRLNGINQDIDNDIEVLHQWHTKLTLDEQGKASKANDEYFTNKKLDRFGPGSEELKANRNHEWGIIKTR